MTCDLQDKHQAWPTVSDGAKDSANMMRVELLGIVFVLYLYCTLIPNLRTTRRKSLCQEFEPEALKWGLPLLYILTNSKFSTEFLLLYVLTLKCAKIANLEWNRVGTKVYYKSKPAIHTNVMCLVTNTGWYAVCSSYGSPSLILSGTQGWHDESTRANWPFWWTIRLRRQ